MPSEWIKTIAQSGPWAVLAFVVLWLGVRMVKWLGVKLFDEEAGVVPRFIKAHNSFTDRTAATNERLALNIMTNTEGLKSLERKIESAWSMRHSDPEVWACLFDNNPVPMAFVNRDGQFLQLNQALCLLIGWTSVELRGMTWQQTSLPDELSVDISNAAELVNGNATSYRLDKSVMRKDGTPIKITLHVFRYPRIGEFRHFVSFYVPR